jgi:hypothetical protein
MLAHWGGIAPAATIYCVHDQGLNDSQFCVGTPLPFPNAIVPMGPLYQNCDIEALDLNRAGGDPFINLYAASGDDTPRPGHLYLIADKSIANFIFDLGDIWKVDSTGTPVTNITEIDAISFHPTTGVLWGWGQHTGLFVIPPPLPSLITLEMRIDPQVGCVANEPPVEIIGATVVVPATEMEIEALTWNWEGTVLYAVENLHNDPVDSHGDSEDQWGQPDFDEGIRLWASDGTHLIEMCPNLASNLVEQWGIPVEIEALEALPEGILPDLIPSTQDLLLLGFHGPKTLLYAVIVTPPLPLTAPLNCDVFWLGEIPTVLNDLEGLAYDPLNI